MNFAKATKLDIVMKPYTRYRRIKEQNRSLLNQVEKLQKALDSVPELRCTAGETVWFDHLHCY